MSKITQPGGDRARFKPRVNESSRRLRLKGSQSLSQMDCGNRPQALVKHLLPSQKLRILSAELEERGNKLQIQYRPLGYKNH